MSDHAQIKQRLENRLAELTKRVEQLEEDLRAPVSPSFSEQATEREGEEVMADLEEAGKAEIAAIRAALARIEEGTYGECASCGKAIAPARLETLPETALCVDCASRREQSH
jgi:DnaK suppressor protein